MTEETNQEATDTAPAVEQPIRIRIEDLEIKAGLATAAEVLYGIMQKNPNEPLNGHIDAARILINTIANSLPRQLPAEEPAEGDAGE